MEDYEREGHEWLRWVQRAIRHFREAPVPSHVVELRQAIAELDRFKTDELPPRLADKQRLQDLNNELEVSRVRPTSHTATPFSSDSSLTPANCVSTRR